MRGVRTGISTRWAGCKPALSLQCPVEHEADEANSTSRYATSARRDRASAAANAPDSACAGMTGDAGDAASARQLRRDRPLEAAPCRAPSGPPACAMSGRPPPPLPPSASAPRTRSTALTRDQIVGHADHDRRLALRASDERDHARADLALRIVGERLQFLGRNVVERAAGEFDAVQAPWPRFSAAAAGRRRAPRLAELAFELRRSSISAASRPGNSAGGGLERVRGLPQQPASAAT